MKASCETRLKCRCSECLVISGDRKIYQFLPYLVKLLFSCFKEDEKGSLFLENREDGMDSITHSLGTPLAASQIVAVGALWLKMCKVEPCGSLLAELPSRSVHTHADYFEVLQTDARDGADSTLFGHRRRQGCQRHPHAYAPCTIGMSAEKLPI